MDCTNDEVLTNEVKRNDESNMIFIRSQSNIDNILIEFIVDGIRLDDKVYMKTSYNEEIIDEKGLSNMRIPQKYKIQFKNRILPNNAIKIEINIPKYYKVTINSISINSVIDLTEIEKVDVSDTGLSKTLASYQRSYGKKLNHESICDTPCNMEDNVEKCTIGTEKVQCENINGWIFGLQDRYLSFWLETKDWKQNNLFVIEIEYRIHASSRITLNRCVVKIWGKNMNRDILFNTILPNSNGMNKFSYDYQFLSNNQVILHFSFFTGCYFEIFRIKVSKMIIASFEPYNKYSLSELPLSNHNKILLKINNFIESNDKMCIDEVKDQKCTDMDGNQITDANKDLDTIQVYNEYKKVSIIEIRTLSEQYDSSVFTFGYTMKCKSSDGFVVLGLFNGEVEESKIKYSKLFLKRMEQTNGKQYINARIFPYSIRIKLLIYSEKCLLKINDFKTEIMAKSESHAVYINNLKDAVNIATIMNDANALYTRNGNEGVFVDIEEKTNVGAKDENDANNIVKIKANNYIYLVLILIPVILLILWIIYHKKPYKKFFNESINNRSL